MSNIYLLKEGKNYSNGINAKLLLNPTGMKHTVNFNKNCLYDLRTVDQSDINKLFGFSFGYHHHNSIRFGWRSNVQRQKIEILAYMHKEGKLIQEWDDDISMGFLDTDRDYHLELKYLKGPTGFDTYYFSIKDEYDILHATAFEAPKFLLPLGYKLYPYFGGNRKAPHDMLITLS